MITDDWSCAASADARKVLQPMVTNQMEGFQAAEVVWSLALLVVGL